MPSNRNLNVIRVSSPRQSKRLYFVEWNKRVYAFIWKSEQERFAAWMGGKRKFIIRLT